MSARNHGAMGEKFSSEEDAGTATRSPAAMNLDSSDTLKPTEDHINGNHKQEGRASDYELEARRSNAPAAPAATLSHSVRRTYLDATEPTVSGLENADTAIRRLQAQMYLVRDCRALIAHGAPSHRLETIVHRTADALQVNIQAFYMPGCMIMSFDDATGRSQDVQIIRCSQNLNLAKLDAVHEIYEDVINKRTTVQDATTRLDELSQSNEQFPRWLRVLMYGLASAFIGPMSYGARPVDLPLIFILGCIVGFCELVVAAGSELYGYVFELTSAILISFLGRALGSVRWGAGQGFCFSAIAQASLVMILPGFTITTSALELQSNNIVSGAVRLVYGIIYTLFLAFGFIVGITIYGAIDDDATSSTTCNNTWPFWWQIAFVLPFTFCYSVVYQAKWKQLPAILAVALAGWVVNDFSARRFPTVQPLSQALGALTVGILANLHSRLFTGLAVVTMHPAIFIQVPGSFAASGSLINGVKSADTITHQNGSANSLPQYGTSPALHAGYAMIEIAVGIAAGLSISAVLTYPIRKKRTTSGLFTY